MNICGLTDSFISVEGVTNECPQCHGIPRVANGLCLACMLGIGLGNETDNGAEFAAILDAVQVPDTHWRLGNYEILEEIGRGGMGVIYRARQRHSRRIVAVKRLLSYHADSRETLARFRREAEAAASLDHPNILPIYEVSESEDRVPFFSMKFAPGGSLQQAAPALHGNFREIVRLMARVTRAVQYAHRQGILHRDLKPGNVLLDGRGEPLVSDFGLAKWLDTSTDLTRTLTIFGTPGYIAPEQARGPAADLKPTADIYSLGAILFDLLAGRPPFLGEHAIAVIQQASEKSAPKLRSLVKTADRDLETICGRCLEREPAARYASAGDLAEDLERWLEGRPIIARPVSPPVRLWRWTKRNPLIAGSLAVTLIIGGLAIGRQVQTRKLAETVREDELASHSIAILPFLNLETAQPDIDFTNSFVVPLQTRMMKLGPSQIVLATEGPAKVPGTGNPSDLRAISSQTGCRAALTGTIRLVGGKQRVAIHLRNTETDDTLFESVTDLARSGTSASEFATGIATSLYQAVGGSRESTRSNDPVMIDPAANEFLRAGDDLMNRRTPADIDRAIGCYQRAIDLQPKSALACAAFTLAVVTRTQLGSGDATLIEKAERYGRQAVALSPATATTHRALASLLLAKSELGEAEEETLRAIEAGGLSDRVTGLAMIEKTRGRPDLGVRWSMIANHWDTRPADEEFLLADSWADLVDDTRAEASYRRVSDLHPELPEGWIGLCRLKLLEHDFAAARQIYQANLDKYRDYRYAREMAAQAEFFSRNYAEAEKLYKELEQEDPGGGGSFFGAISYQSALGRLQSALGDNSSAQSTLGRCLDLEREALAKVPQHPETLYRLAAIQAMLGDSHLALKYLQESMSAGWIDYRSLSLDPRFDNISNEPEFRSILEIMRKTVGDLKLRAPAQVTL